MVTLSTFERDVLFVKKPVTGVDIPHRVSQGAKATAHKHFRERIRKFAERSMRPDPANADNIPFLRYDDLPEGAVISKNNLMWRNNKYIISMRLLNLFFNILSQVDISLHIKLILETDTRKLFKCIGAGGANPAAIDIN